MMDHSFSNVRTVAVTGFGPSGCPAARHLQDAGLEVRVFERQPMAGGIWNWRPETALPIAVPTPPPSRGAFTPVEVSGPSERVYEDGKRSAREEFCPANPVYASLSNNVPTSTLAFKDFPYPSGTQPNIRHEEIARYVQSYARHFGIDLLTSHNTRVETVEKIHGRWRLALRSVEAVPLSSSQVRERTWVEEFDAVVVATGHYTAPFIPDLPGLSAWAKQWPTQVIHSQGYRRPESYAKQNVVIVGIGTSGIDIAWDLVDYARTVYLIGKDKIEGPDQHLRQRQLQRHLIPPKAVHLCEIRRLHQPSSSRIEDGVIELTSGERLTGISTIIFASGYQYSFPFLSHLHMDSGTMSTPETLVTTGEGVHNLHRDVFYIPDPTLAFLGLSINTSAFSFFEYQALSVARVFARKAILPSYRRMRELNASIAREKGGSRFVHLLGKEGERKYVRETVEWLNRDAERFGGDAIEGHTEEWLKASDTVLPRIAAKYGVDVQDVLAEDGSIREVTRSRLGDSRENVLPPIVAWPVLPADSLVPPVRIAV